MNTVKHNGHYSILSASLVLLMMSSSFLLSSCFSLLKADKLTYVGTMGKRIDTQLVDSLNTTIKSY